MRRVLGWLAAVPLVLLLGLPGYDPRLADAAPVHTPGPTPAEIVLFRDDFATYSNRWSIRSTPKASVAYLGEALNLRVTSPGVSVWSVPDFNVPLVDYRIQVAVDFRGGSRDSSGGIILHYQNDKNFYAWLVDRDGAWRFLLRDGADWIDLTPQADASMQLYPVDWLRVEVSDRTFTFYIDDRWVGDVTDDTLSGGLFGLIAQAGRGYIDVSFDDLLVSVGMD